MNKKTPSRRRELTGIVVSDKMRQTAVVEITHQQKHPQYLKYYTVTKRLKAHNEGGEFKIGDRVRIQETRPLSKEKHWRIISKALTEGNKVKNPTDELRNTTPTQSSNERFTSQP